MLDQRDDYIYIYIYMPTLYFLVELIEHYIVDVFNSNSSSYSHKKKALLVYFLLGTT